MLRAIADGERDPAAVAALGSPRLHATTEQLCDALGASTDLHPLYRRLLAMTLAELDVLESHRRQLAQGTRGAASRASGCSTATRGGSWSRYRLGAADHRGSRSYGDDVSDGQAPSLLGGGLPWARRECRYQPQSPLAERQPPDASIAQSDRARRGEDQGQYFRAALPTVRRTSRPCSSDRRDRASALSADTEDSARRRRVRGTRPRSQQSARTTASHQGLTERAALEPVRWIGADIVLEPFRARALVSAIPRIIRCAAPATRRA